MIREQPARGWPARPVHAVPPPVAAAAPQNDERRLQHSTAQVRIASHMDSPLHDVRFACRLLWKDKAFSLATVLTLAVCIGANTALFSIVYSVLLKPLPVPESERLVLLYNSYPRRRGGARVERGSRLLRPRQGRLGD